MRELYNNNDIVIKPADKGGSIVIMNTSDYILEANRQLNNNDHYEKLTGSNPQIQHPYQQFNRPSMET